MTTRFGQFLQVSCGLVTLFAAQLVHSPCQHIFAGEIFNVYDYFLMSMGHSPRLSLTSLFRCKNSAPRHAQNRDIPAEMLVKEQNPVPLV